MSRPRRRWAGIPLPAVAASIGAASIPLYVAVLVRIALNSRIQPQALGSSPASVANGHVIPLITSGLVIDGPAVPQIAALAATLALALRQFGTIRTWRTALTAHVGGTLLAYVGVWALDTLDHGFVEPVLHAPDYGISVVLTSELGAVLRAHKPRLIPPTASALAAATTVTCCIAGQLDPLTLANLEHLLGFVIGAALTTGEPQRKDPHRRINVVRRKSARRPRRLRWHPLGIQKV